jgi:2-oxoisovalerate dehydrogenase E2 component (dihydrolipoyl transacylase)
MLNAHIPKQYLTSNLTPERPAAVSASSVYPAPTPAAVPEGGHYTKLTYLPILLKTLSRAMQAWPLFRSSITPDTAPGAKPTLTVRPGADIAVALSTPTGLYTPTLRSVERESAYALAASLRALAHRGRQVPSGLTPADMPRRGGTLTVSNVGALGAGESAHPVLVPGGGVAIAALGRAKWVWDVDRSSTGERRLHLPVSWSADHRVVEGAEMAAFVEEWRSWVENPERMIAEGL